MVWLLIIAGGIQALRAVEQFVIGDTRWGVDLLCLSIFTFAAAGHFGGWGDE